MGQNSNIEWTDHTWNPWEGCQKVGPGCDHCYAETRNARFAGGQPINWGPGAPRRRTSAKNWYTPFYWNDNCRAFMKEHGRRQRVFCASLADWLDNAVDVEWLVDLLGLIRVTPDLDWLLLSKRIGNWRGRLEAAAEWLRERLATAGEATVALLRWIERWLDGSAPANVWLGATIVNQAEADRDISKLLAVPALVRFLSMEPLLGPVDLEQACDIAERNVCAGTWSEMADPGRCALALRYGSVRLLDWVIVGGESGPGARPMHPEWARSLRDQCQRAGVPFLFKQHGEWLPADDDGETVRLTFPLGAPTGPDNPEWHTWPDGVKSARVGKKAAGRLLDGRTWDEVPG